MSLFNKIKHAIFGDKGPLGGQFSGKAGTAPSSAPSPAPAGASPASAPVQTPQATPNATSPAAASPVDVEQVLEQKAAAKGQPSNWRSSIVDLLKLLDLDSSLQARKELADELDVHAGADGSAEQNIALHRAVMKKLAENGGKIPAGLAD